jgi:hypothetical protein
MRNVFEEALGVTWQGESLLIHVLMRWKHSRTAIGFLKRQKVYRHHTHGHTLVTN